MPSTIQIKDLFCYETIDINLPDEGPVLVTGANSSGKTSFANILAAVFCHDSNPCGLSAAHMKQYVRDGATEGYAAFGDVMWTPPEQIQVPQTVTPVSLPHAVGRINFIKFATSKSERVKVWENLFLPENALDIIKPYWTGTDQQLQAVIKVIDREGWDAAAKLYAGEKTRFRRNWEDATGERFGNKKAAEWKPEEWSVDLEGLSEDDVTSAYTDANDALRALTVQTAVSQERIDEAVRIRDEQIPPIKEKLEALNAENVELIEAKNLASETYRNITNTFRELNAEIDATEFDMKSIKAKATSLGKADWSCEQCGKKLYIAGDKISEVDEAEIEREKDVLRKKFAVLKKERAGMKEKQAEMQEVVNTACTDAEKANKKQYEKQQEVNKLQGEIRALEKLTAPADETANTEEIDAAERSRLENMQADARRRVEAWRANDAAQRALDNYTEKEMIQKLLEPGGARLEFMQRHMDKVRKALASISKVTGWAELTITRTYEVLSGGRAIQLCAANEQYKAQWALQIAVAMLNPDKCRFIVLDAADILDAASWSGLEKLVSVLRNKFKGIQVIVCATETDQPHGWDVVDLDN